MLGAVMAGLSLGLLLSLSVGPVIFAIIKNSINNGFKAGLSFVLGVSFSDTMFVVLGNFATSFIEHLEDFKLYIGIGGGIMLLIIGIYGMFFKKVVISTGDEKPELFRKRDYIKIWLSGYLMNTLNPGVFLFWLGTCTTAITAFSLKYRIVLFLTTLIFVLSADILKVFMSDKIRHKLTLNTVIWLNRIASASMMIFGCILMYEVIFNANGKLLGG